MLANADVGEQVAARRPAQAAAQEHGHDPEPPLVGQGAREQQRRHDQAAETTGQLALQALPEDTAVEPQGQPEPHAQEHAEARPAVAPHQQAGHQAHAKQRDKKAETTRQPETVEGEEGRLERRTERHAEARKQQEGTHLQAHGHGGEGLADRPGALPAPGRRLPGPPAGGGERPGPGSGLD